MYRRHVLGFFSKITSKKTIDLEGRIVRIVDRKLENVVGEVYSKNGKLYIDLEDEKLKKQMKGGNGDEQ